MKEQLLEILERLHAVPLIPTALVLKTNQLDPVRCLERALVHMDEVETCQMMVSERILPLQKVRPVSETCAKPGDNPTPHEMSAFFRYRFGGMQLPVTFITMRGSSIRQVDPNHTYLQAVVFGSLNPVDRQRFHLMHEGPDAVLRGNELFPEVYLEIGGSSYTPERIRDKMRSFNGKAVRWY